LRAARASVKAPRAWPNSSLSINDSGTAAQLSATKGRSARLLSRCSARAATSLPVPLSPVINTVVSVGAMRAMSSFTCVMAGLSPMISSTEARCACTAERRRLTSSRKLRCCTARPSTSATASTSTGLVMKS
jgi:hypothetical protein